MTGERLRVVVSGMVAGDAHQGGATWAVLQWVIGLRRLGHDVLLVEPIAEYKLGGQRFESSAQARYFQAVVEEFELGGTAALLLRGTRRTVGIDYADAVARAGQADLLVNVSGMLDDPELAGPPPVRTYLDLDPAFVQLWDEQGICMGFEGHNRFVTVGLALGTGRCTVPTRGLSWMTTVPPVVLDRWPVGGRIAHDAFTTVGNWRGYGSVEHRGRLYGQKAHSYRTLVDLPSRTAEALSPALGIWPGDGRDRDVLVAAGWRLLDPAQVASTPSAYAQFVRGSKAELCVAKSGYVDSRCGWFSDRSACYLASGRPVVASETGLSAYLPVGKGLLTFGDSGEAADAIDQVNADYAGHRRAARRLAEEHLSSDLVIADLLDRL